MGIIFQHIAAFYLNGYGAKHQTERERWLQLINEV